MEERGKTFSANGKHFEVRAEVVSVEASASDNDAPLTGHPV